LDTDVVNLRGRFAADYFDDIPDEKIPKDMLNLGSHIVKTKLGHFEPSKFEDQYEDALKDLLKRKQEGKPIDARNDPNRQTSLTLWMPFGRVLRQAERPPQAKRKILRQLGVPLRRSNLATTSGT
jgi:non-homologous end joining protein Ku